MMDCLYINKLIKLNKLIRNMFTEITDQVRLKTLYNLTYFLKLESL